MVDALSNINSTVQNASNPRGVSAPLFIITAAADTVLLAFCAAIEVVFDLCLNGNMNATYIGPGAADTSIVITVLQEKVHCGDLSAVGELDREVFFDITKDCFHGARVIFRIGKGFGGTVR